ncbi:MAG: P-loop NTPase [Candidatus Marinimicrobia bacterium]|nr:P-loop NTPase [Candidatus Neomarinimicrobiota bacterium]MDD9887788.1 P-loop NTPase [Candidatus Neomarinimicrobiota bacterium]MDD9931809.1 P-loop NTPase [Candidatus Neomarinimicrobiota bacterium]
MDKKNILEILKTITYPGFSRDIVSFGMVEDVNVNGDSVLVKLKITTQQEEKKSAVIQEVEQVLKGTKAFKDVQVSVVEGAPPSASGPAPQSAQNQPASPLDGIKHVIAVASGKGGVGKSTVAANLALSLRDAGHKVGLLDLDIYGPSLPIILGINEQPDLTQDRKLIPLDHMDMKIMSFGFISGNQTPVIWRGPLVARMTEQFFRDVVWGELDYLILDLPPGTGDVQLTLTQKLKIDGAVIVTTPQDIALADVRKGADMFKKVHTPVLGVIENMSGLFLEGEVTNGKGVSIEGQPVDVGEDGRFAIRIDLFKKGGGKSESERLDVPLLGEIPISQDIMEATDAGKPISAFNPEAHVTKIYKSIAEKVVDTLH